MKICPISKLRTLAKEYNWKGVVIFSFDEEQFGYTSYGQTKRDCETIQNMADDIHDLLVTGELKPWDR